MNIEVRHLRLVEAITAEGSVTRAAERLNVTQSALSHQLREIEDRLGTPLFLRVKRRLVLAPAGERLLASARRILGDLRAAEEDIARLATHQDGVVRVSTACYTCYSWLPPLLGAFQRRFPGVDVEIVPEVTRGAIDALLERRIDLALVHDVPRDRRIRLAPAFDDEVVVITARDHPLAKKPFVVACDLAEEHVILHSPAEDSFFARQLRAAEVRPRKYSHVTLTEAIVELVRAGIGVSAVPRWTVARELRARGIAAVPFTRKGLWRKWSAATLATATPSAPVTTLIELIRDARG
ncbi:MAG TPA: LysR family transcriptional regulator [Thermoanaerobaculia bacterium]|nr:LysR family transcriptional regulator [Thermoanaerobaculia bacterium]